VGINNRDLATLKVDLGVTKRILEQNSADGKVVVSESGISTAADVRFLRLYGAQAFLVGSAVMLASDVEGKIKELVSAL
jgi:indole-3-glycerol phosphate synthase